MLTRLIWLHAVPGREVASGNDWDCVAERHGGNGVTSLIIIYWVTIAISGRGFDEWGIR